jgi:hypothetical protein
MSDITKCTNAGCPKAGTCYRILAKDGEMQSYAAFECEAVEYDYYVPANNGAQKSASKKQLLRKAHKGGQK